MTSTLTPSPRAGDTLPTDERFLAMATEVGRRAAPHDAAHDRDATFVTEAYEAMAQNGYLAMAVPAELGGGGASLRQVVLAECELARWSGASALAAASAEAPDQRASSYSASTTWRSDAPPPPNSAGTAIAR